MAYREFRQVILPRIVMAETFTAPAVLFVPSVAAAPVAAIVANPHADYWDGIRKDVRRHHIVEVSAVFYFLAPGLINFTSIDVVVGHSVTPDDGGADAWDENGDSLQTFSPIPAVPVAGKSNVRRFVTGAAGLLSIRTANKVGGDANSHVDLVVQILNEPKGGIV